MRFPPQPPASSNITPQSLTSEVTRFLLNNRLHLGRTRTCSVFILGGWVRVQISLSKNRGKRIDISFDLWRVPWNMNRDCIEYLGGLHHSYLRKYLGTPAMGRKPCPSHFSSSSLWFQIANDKEHLQKWLEIIFAVFLNSEYFEPAAPQGTVKKGQSPIEDLWGSVARH